MRSEGTCVHVAKESGYLIFFSNLWTGRVMNMTNGEDESQDRAEGKGSLPR